MKPGQTHIKTYLLLWGKNDQFIKSDQLPKWENALKKAAIKQFDCSHFVQEEEFETSMECVATFLGQKVEPLKGQ